MLSGQRLQPCGASAESWNGEILSLPSASTLAGLVTISEKQPSTPWCARTVSMKKALASLTTLRSHLQQEQQQQTSSIKDRSVPSANAAAAVKKRGRHRTRAPPPP